MGVFAEIFPEGLFLLVCIMALAALVPNEGQPRGPMRDGERVSWLFLLIPFGAYLLAEFVTDFFHNRYVIAMLPGAAVGSASFIWRQFGANRKIAAGAFLLLAGFGVRSELLAALHPERIVYFGERQAGTRSRLALEGPILADGKRYITSPQLLVIKEVRYYSKHPEHYAELNPRPSELVLARYDPSILCWDTNDLRWHASETAVISPTPDFVAEMARAGIRATAAPNNAQVLYLAPIER